MEAKFLLKNDAGTRLHPVRCPSRVNKKDMFVRTSYDCPVTEILVPPKIGPRTNVFSDNFGPMGPILM